MDWWNAQRIIAQKSTQYHCAACGIHKNKIKDHDWLEAHEYVNVDHPNCVCEFINVVPLCYYCHKFIHVGLLHLNFKLKTISKKEVVEILEHGFKILADSKLQCNPEQFEVAKHFKNLNTLGVTPYSVKPSEKLNPFDWKLLMDNNFYTWK